MFNEREIQTLKEMLESTVASLKALTPAIRLRHAGAGMGLYDQILKAEAALLTLERDVSNQLENEKIR
jgi:hypothetical protein